MTVSELKKLLKKYPDDMEIVNERRSDYQIIEPDEWSIVSGVDQFGWVMRSHPTMSEANKAREKQYLALASN
jgi:hypothetical protein